MITPSVRRARAAAAIAQLSAALQRPVPAYLFVGQTGWELAGPPTFFAGELLARHDPEIC